MKQIILTLALVAGVTLSATAQQPFKFGHINSQELFLLMPERDSALVKLENYRKELTEQIETLQVEFNKKLTDYQNKQSTWTAATLETKQKELQQLSQNIEEYQRNAQEELAQMQQIVIRPVTEKANAAISKVGKDNEFTYIFDVSMGVVPYFNLEQSIDVLPLVKTELNIPADKVAPTTSTTTSR
ncbi:MAG: OmpH family outer membrane protein [Prevotellaceae bacterium]|jgi:outer membrane protein|nr:OmpH family outer membrane protein [Prevotellaceae bacterium]